MNVAEPALFLAVVFHGLRMARGPTHADARMFARGGWDGMGDALRVSCREQKRGVWEVSDRLDLVGWVGSAGAGYSMWLSSYPLGEPRD
jgi:hypothetical protein